MSENMHMTTAHAEEIGGSSRYPHVFRPLRLGPVTVRNRIFVPAHTTSYGEDNLPTQRHLDYHRARAAGGAGLIVFEAARVHPSSLGRKQGVNGYDPAGIPRFAAIARAVQQEGAKFFGQIIHLGRHIDGNFARMPAWSSSAVPWSMTAPPPHPMTSAEIRLVVEAHGTVARHMEEAGLDGVEVAMGHGHLLQQFLSPAVNRRTDAYGGSVENRMRMGVEALQAVRDAVGHRLALGVRISADEFLEGGLDLAQMQEIAARLCDAVALDYVSVSHSAYHGSASISTQMADMAFPRDGFHHLPRAIAASLKTAGHDIPVFAVCRFSRVAEAEAMLASGDIAAIGMARAHIADPALVRKAAEGRNEETRPCIACNQGCVGFLALSLPITCLTNPAAGREAEWPADPAPATMPKRVAVVGGGPAGMEAAAVAAQRGHEVTLYEALDRLGGTLRWNERMPARTEFLRLLAAQEQALHRHGVEIRLGHTAVAAELRAYDAVVLATGGLPQSLTLPGGGTTLTLEAALADPQRLGAHVAVHDQVGSFAMTGFLEWLASTVREVTVLAPTGAPGWQMSMFSSLAWRQRLKEKRVRILGLHAAHAHAGTTLTLRDLSTGELRTIAGVDTVVAPLHATPNMALQAALEDHPAMHAIGDCVAARSALEAVFEGHQLGRTL